MKITQTLVLLAGLAFAADDTTDTTDSTDIDTSYGLDIYTPSTTSLAVPRLIVAGSGSIDLGIRPPSTQTAGHGLSAGPTSTSTPDHGLSGLSPGAGLSGLTGDDGLVDSILPPSGTITPTGDISTESTSTTTPKSKAQTNDSIRLSQPSIFWTAIGTTTFLCFSAFLVL